MLTLIHHPICPFSRQVRVAMLEKQLVCEYIIENYWLKSENLGSLNPALALPVLVKPGQFNLSSIYSILEYLEEEHSNCVALMSKDTLLKAEERRLLDWFNNKFYHEVSKYIIYEKIVRFYEKKGTPNSESIRHAKHNIHFHMEYISFLLSTHKWLASEKFTFVDIAAASQLSILDYMGDVPWERYPDAKEWYALVKSRPSFRELLKDKFSGFQASTNYANLDF